MDHHFLPQGRELDKKFCPGGQDSLAQKNFPRGCPGGDVPSWNRLRHYNRLLHASTGANTVALASGVSTIGTSVTIVGIPISASLGVVSTVSTFVGACLLLTSKKYKKKLLKCYELLDKITSSLATFETLISLSIDDGSVIDAKEFHKLQTLYLQLMTEVRNIDRKMKVETEQNFQKTIMDEITNLKKALEQK